MSERWKTVPSEPNYEVSDLGRVRSKDFVLELKSRCGKPYKRRHKGRLLSGAIQPNGYLDITVDSRRDKDGKRVPRRRSVASMVLEAFKGSRPSPKHQSRHLNDIKADNRLTNLKWGLCQQNAEDRMRNGTAYRPMGILHPMAKLNPEKVRLLRKVYRRYGTEHIELAKRFGITGGTAHAIGTGKGWPHVK